MKAATSMRISKASKKELTLFKVKNDCKTLSEAILLALKRLEEMK